MCSPDIEPLITSEVRTRARAAAEAAAKTDPPASNEATSVQGSANAQIQEEQQAAQAEAGADASAGPATDEERRRVEAEALDAAGQGGSVFLDESYVIFCGHAVEGDKKNPDVLPDPRTWDEAMEMPDREEWIKASKAERKNLEDHKVFLTVPPKQVKKLQDAGVTIHTAKNVLKKKLDSDGK
eukprot:3889502-Rhodomonas_salina.1